MIYKSKNMSDLIDLATTVAKSDVSILIQGESGVGKEILVNYIHKHSTRNTSPLVKINCGAIPEDLLESELFGYEPGSFTGANSKGKIGLLEMANFGSLFLDEISTLSFQLQTKLLHAIQKKEILKIGALNYTPVDMRIISATNEDLLELVDLGLFRRDLYYRLNIISLCVPPLRERKEDIAELTTHFLEIYNLKYNTKKYFSSASFLSLKSHSWPGNVRELENLIEKLVITSHENEISLPLLSSSISATKSLPSSSLLSNSGLKKMVLDYEKDLIVLYMPYFNKSQELANFFKIDKSTLLRKMKQYGISNIYID